LWQDLMQRLIEAQYTPTRLVKAVLLELEADCS